MLFNSIEFLIFLPIVFLLYWLVFNRHTTWRNGFIVTVSYVFYGWWNWKFLLLIAFTSFCSWISGLGIEKYRHRGSIAKTINAANIIVNLGVLGVFKYYNFFVSSFADVFLHGNNEGLLLHVMLPVGISFYTFQALSYSIDVYKEKIAPTRNMMQFFAFVSFFPQLVAGPIERATHLLPQFAVKSHLCYESLTSGLRQMVWGFFKKMVVADNLAIYVNLVYNNVESYHGLPLIWAAIFFTFQIYADFSGYSDIAIGTARIFGFDLMTNFRRPYLSRSIKEYWSRWHISLSTWFRDYVYIPLGGNRVSTPRWCVNIMITFLLSGFWHGAVWTFVIWGGVHGLLQLTEKICHLKQYKYDIPVKLNQFFRVILTFGFVALAFILFRANSFTDAIYIYSHLLDFTDNGIIGVPLCSVRTFVTIVMAMLSLCIADIVCDRWPQRLKLKPWCYCMMITLEIWLIYAFGVFEEQSFIYFQF